ncbi:uncharacterized protein LOC130904393 [Corythoichthys intestinalis]|uniref:uncharacterized protein LOC130904393 n=1 Tax=Corythoichthys intestinalis TaxID=161448 RepID=UPI0025A55B8E|nr:uncharacterized protein LOC130904393 [Corythoichthys intestinalis]
MLLGSQNIGSSCVCNILYKLLSCSLFSTGCDDYGNSPFKVIMPLSDDEPICPKFQANIFDPSRCHDCLRQRHLHHGTDDNPEVAPQKKSTTDPVTGPKHGMLLTPIPSQAEERDTSSKEDSDRLSVVSSYCDVARVCPGHVESSFCILSPDCELYICDGDDDNSTDSCSGQSDYKETSGSGSAEDEYPPLRMTRLDPPPHRPNARAWMDEAHNRDSRDSFSRRSGRGFKEHTEKRESGYFSLGRATGARATGNNGPQAPFRHLERGHPVFSNKNFEPKDTIPFRNPNLGLASERQVPEVLDEELPVEIPPPDPYDIAVEVEAQVGARSPSPTPFKIAESLATVERKGFLGSYGRGKPSFNSFHQQLGRFDSSRHGSTLQSRSSSPACENIQLRRRDFLSPTRGHAMDRVQSQGTDLRQRGSHEGSQGRRLDSRTLPKNFKSLAGSVKTQSSTVSDFRSALRKAETSGSPTGRRHESRASSPGKTALRTTVSSLHTHDSHKNSPSRRAFENHFESRGSSPTRRIYSSSGQSVLRKSDSMTSLDGRSHHGRCGSPIREGYDIESQALLRNGLNGQDHEYPESSLTTHGHDTPSQPKHHMTGFINGSSSQGHSERRSYHTTGQYPLRKTASSTSFNGRESRNSSPSRRSYEDPSKSEVKSHSSLPFRRNHSSPHQNSLRKSEFSSSFKRNNHNSRNSSPSRNATSDFPGYSVLRNATNGEGGHSFQRKNHYSDFKYATDRSPRSWRGSTNSLRSSSLSRAASPTIQNTKVNRKASGSLQTPRSPAGARSRVGRNGLEDHRYSSPNDKRPHLVRSHSPTTQLKTQSHTLSQSSMDSSESVASTGRNKEIYSTMADLPKVKIIHQRDDHGYMERPSNRQRARRQELFKPASHSLSKHPSREWDDTRETDREWYNGGSGYLSRAHSSSSLQRSCSPTADEGISWKDHNHRFTPMQIEFELCHLWCAGWGMW